MSRLILISQFFVCLALLGLYFSANTAFGLPYIYTGESKIPVDQFQYLEGVDEKINLSDLKKAVWKNEIEDIHSYYNGFWLKLAVLNQTDKSDLGIRHWTTFEKSYL